MNLSLRSPRPKLELPRSKQKKLLSPIQTCFWSSNFAILPRQINFIAAVLVTILMWWINLKFFSCFKNFNSARLWCNFIETSCLQHLDVNLDGRILPVFIMECSLCQLLILPIVIQSLQLTQMTTCLYGEVSDNYLHVLSNFFKDSSTVCWGQQTNVRGAM